MQPLSGHLLACLFLHGPLIFTHTLTFELLIVEVLEGWETFSGGVVRGELDDHSSPFEITLDEFRRLGLHTVLSEMSSITLRGAGTLKLERRPSASTLFADSLTKSEV